MTSPRQKLRECLEYWQLVNQHGEIIRTESIRGSFPLLKDKILVVREVSPALDEAYREMERALENIKNSFNSRDNWTLQDYETAMRHDEHEADFALSKLREARK